MSIILVMTGVSVCVLFTTNSIIVFMLAFESCSLLVLLVIVQYGYNVERIESGRYLVVYTVVGSLPLMLFLVKLQIDIRSVSLLDSSYSDLSVISSVCMLLLMLVKLPLFVVHY